MPAPKLDDSEAHFLSVICPEGTISVGTTIGYKLHRRGLVKIAKFGRYGITPAGAEAIKAWRAAQDAARATKAQGDLAL